MHDDSTKYEGEGSRSHAKQGRHCCSEGDGKAAVMAARSDGNDNSEGGISMVLQQQQGQGQEVKIQRCRR